MRYKVNAYLCTNFAGLMDSLETDDFYEVQDFIWENCQKGLNCELWDRETGNRNWAYADDFTDDTIDPSGLISDEFYADLLMEQHEQM